MENKDLLKFDSYAIFATGGKQYQAIVGKTIAIEKIDGDSGARIEFKEVLFKKSGDEKFEVGHPYVEGAIKASIVKQTQGPKLIAFKFGRRNKIRTKKGHRQQLTIIRIESI